MKARGATYFGRGDGAADRASGGDNAPFRREDILLIRFSRRDFLALVLALCLVRLEVNVYVL
jgi:hypothetical protein